jgi:hypothetical protein
LLRPKLDFPHLIPAQEQACVLPGVFNLLQLPEGLLGAFEGEAPALRRLLHLSLLRKGSRQPKRQEKVQEKDFRPEAHQEGKFICKLLPS